MIEGVTDSKQYLYHYTKSSTAIDHILKHRTLRFNSYSSTNDPKETKTWQFDLGTNEQRDLSRYDMQKESESLSQFLKGRTRLLCFCQDASTLSGNHLSDMSKRGYCKPRMWAQYCDNHMGVCLVFDKQALTAEITHQVASSHPIVSGPVEYVDHDMFDPPFEKQPYVINIDALEDLGREEYARLHLEKHVKRLFFEKMTDWQNECEWRWVVFSNTRDDLYVKFRSSLVGLMFGTDTSDKTIESMMNMLKPLEVQYMKLKWKNCNPWYAYGDLRFLPGIENSPWSETLRRPSRES